MSWRLAKSLGVLRAQIDRAHPNRDRSSDGTIGDERHQASVSDHNPNRAGVVTAIDITHDPAHGVDSYHIAEVLRLNRDERIKYVISNRRIFSASLHPWEWRPYYGTNPHDQHVHISVVADPVLYDATAEWELAAYTPEPTRPEPANVNIKATIFGGDSEVERSAYDGHRIGDEEIGCALPFRFAGQRPIVRVYRDGRHVDCPVLDVGPWETDDPYWLEKRRPKAESGRDSRGRRTNRAGIDLTPAAARALGIGLEAGSGLVDWEFVH